MAVAQKLVTSPSRPPTRDRAPSCTHLQLTRLFDGFGCERCSICHRRPQLGWLYRCTQDFDGFLPASDFYDVQDHKRLDHDAQLYTLSAAITKAAANGDYTDQELNILWKQKLDLSDYSQLCRGPLEPIQEVHDDLEQDHRLHSFAKPTPPPLCNFKVCQTCRPIYQQRAWQSIDGVLKSPYKQPPKHEMANRRISDVNVVKHIGHLDAENYTSKRNSRTQFQDIVQQLLIGQERSSEEYETGTAKQGHGLKRVAAAQSLFDPNTKDAFDDALSEKASRTSSSFLRPLYHRRGSERFPTIQASSQKAESQCGESMASTVLPTSQDGSSCTTAVIGLKIDTMKANADRENIPPAQKTPTESIKESLCRFSGLRKTSARFAID
ncbi:hypothetical protein OHC33_006888 [Knufia fluminis]|uniref:Uncharacterized protein n=1 Tax=Knufia fluminis TaxID=191047 RepID=A0AAN8EJ27_9EURO|nr:hypothetical protein OHC33_006888 [Knufia fluminis]